MALPVSLTLVEMLKTDAFHAAFWNWEDIEALINAFLCVLERDVGQN